MVYEGTFCTCCKEGFGIIKNLFLVDDRWVWEKCFDLYLIVLIRKEVDFVFDSVDEQRVWHGF